MKDSDALLVGFDHAGGDNAVLIISRKDSDDKMQVINEFYGKEAEELYKKLIGQKEETHSDLIPLWQVLEDMYDPDGGMKASGARSYYYTNYATEEERKAMDLKDKIEMVLVIIFMIAFWVAVGFALISSFINK